MQKGKKVQAGNKGKLYLAAAVGVATLIIYLPALRNEFVYWDDNVYIFDNPWIRSLGADFFRWAFLDFYAANWHPLTWISHALDYALWGLNPMGHHLTSIVLHAVNAFLVVTLATMILESAKKSAEESGVQQFPEGSAILIAAGTTGLLFGIHPLHVESAAWVSERKDLLCALFFLLTLIMYIKYARGTSSEAHRAEGIGQREDRNAAMTVRLRFTDKRYLAALALFLLALLSKPMAVTLPVALMILDWCPLNRIDSLKTLRKAAVEKIPFFALSLLSSGVTIAAQKTEKAFETLDFMPLPARALVAAKSLVAYMGKMIIPLNLVPFYPYPGRISVGSFEYLSAIALVIAISTGCFLVVKKQKFWLAAWGYYVVTLIPVIGIVQVGGQSMADRYTYLPSIGPFLAAGLGTAWISEKMHRAKPARTAKTLRITVALILVACLSLLTINQIRIWRNSIVLWTYEIEKRSEKIPMAYVNRGAAFQRKGQFDKAVADYETAIGLDPAAFRAYISLGTVFETMGQTDKALANIEKAIVLNPSSPEAYRNRGILYEKTGRLDAAIADFTRAIDLKPSYFEAYNNRGIVFGKLGQFEKAIADYDQALRINPLHFSARSNRAIAYTLIGRYGSALRDFNSAILLNQHDPTAYFNRGLFYQKIGKNELSRADFQRACDLGNQEACGLMNQASRF